MNARIAGLPDGYFGCQWCNGGVRYGLNSDGTRNWPARCPHCGMHPHPNKVDETVGGKVDPEVAKKAARNRRTAQRVVPLSTQRTGQVVMGIDPGYRYTGIVVRDGDVVLHASTLVRDKDQKDPIIWARHVADTCRMLLFTNFPPDTKVGIEGVTEPKGFKHGQRATLNPAHIVFTGVVAGCVAGAFPDAVIIPPGGNGSQHVTHYPPALVGRRPADLPGSSNGAGTRAHEQSAFDVAGKAAKVWFPPAADDTLAQALTG